MKILCITLSFLSSVCEAQTQVIHPHEEARIRRNMKYLEERAELLAWPHKPVVNIPNLQECDVFTAMIAKVITRKDVYPKLDVYTCTWIKCLKIFKELSDHVGHNIENDDFPWDTINRSFLGVFFKTSDAEDLTTTLNDLAKEVRIDDQQNITEFLSLFDLFKKTKVKQGFRREHVHNIIDKLIVIEKIAVEGFKEMQAKPVH